MAANDRQIGGTHYRFEKERNYQHWDMVHEMRLDYFQGQITKYVIRWRNKGGIHDLRKAQHFLEKYIELCEADEETLDKVRATTSVRNGSSQMGEDKSI